MIAWLATVAGGAYGDLYALTWDEIGLRWGAHAQVEEERAEALREARQR